MAFPELGTQPFDNTVRLGRTQNDRGQKRTQFFRRHAPHKLAFVGVGNHAVLLGYDHDQRVGLLAQTNGGAMARAERLIQIAPLRQRKNTRGIGDTVALDDDAAVMNGIVRKENRLQHFRRDVAIHLDAGLDGFLKLDGLLYGDEGSDLHVGEALDGLDDDLDAFALLVGAGE